MCSRKSGAAQQHYGTYEPSPVVSSRSCLASSSDEAGTSTSLVRLQDRFRVVRYSNGYETSNLRTRAFKERAQRA
jgi:hypothetical protein